ncbi:glutamate receptor ionotropic, delta-1-like [Periplaneta americana]|uniref:glutamate receptor ionotropic, delta-1-like n=1 Tax=Periplaneta americana TaxID=6978 RepID=UPI0037E79884
MLTVEVNVNKYNGRILNFKSEGEVKGVSGFAGDIWENMAKALNFSLNGRQVEKSGVRFIQQKDSWSGLQKDLEQGHIDVIPFLEVESSIPNNTDFTQPFYMSGFHLFVKGEEHFSWIWPLTPFSQTLWFAIVACIITATSSAYVSNRMVIRDQKYRPDFFSNFLHIYGFFCCQGSAPSSSGISVRTVTLCSSLLATVLIQAYSATLVSHIAAVTQQEPPFQDLHGLLHSRYSLAVVKGSYIHSKLQNAAGDIYEDIWKKSTFLVESFEEAMIEVCYGQVAIFIPLEMHENNQCKVMAIKGLYFSSWRASGLVKGFPCKNSIDTTILHLREIGIFNLLKARYFPHLMHLQRHLQSTSNIENGVQLYEAIPIFTLYAVGLILAVTFVLLEKAITSCTYNRYVLI